MKYEITKEFGFDSAHQLGRGKKFGAEVFGKCNNVHGHTYKMFVTVGADELVNGMVMNFTLLKKLVGELIEDLDHKLLNDVSWLSDRETTCEYMAETIFHILQEKINEEVRGIKVTEIKLYETPTSYTTYRG